jgi:uncharacterized protein (TIGR02594 family)
MPEKEFPVWMGIAKKYVGVAEIPGPRSNPTILRMLRSTDIGRPYDQTELTPWCSAAVNLIMEEARDIDPRIDPPTMSAAAASWARYGRELEYGQYGCIVVMSRPGGNHVGFYHDEGEDEEGNYFVRLLGGNQGDKQCIASFRWDRITNFRWPKNYPLGE